MGKAQAHKVGRKTVYWIPVLTFILSLGFLGPAEAAVSFFDNFDAGPSSSWGNELGNWYAASGVYRAASPSNSPTTYTSLPFILSDLTFETTINNVEDGGLWLHCTYAGSNQQPHGVLLVVKNTSIYWHVVDGVGYDWAIFEERPLTSATNRVVKVVVSGNTYSAYVNDVLATTLNDSTFMSGKVALYSYSSQTFDDVNLTGTAVPIPGALLLLGPGLAGLAIIRASRRAFCSQWA